MDTTVETPPMKIRGGSKDAVYASLRQPELYEPDSDEEFWIEIPQNKIYQSMYYTWRHGPLTVPRIYLLFFLSSYARL